MPVSGDRYDRFLVEDVLGQGGMATVYLAQDLRHDRKVAIKVLHEDLGATLGPERFLAELDRLVSSLSLDCDWQRRPHTVFTEKEGSVRALVEEHAVAVAAGGAHSLALKADGTVVAWGANTFGQATVPAGLTAVVALAAGGTHSLALRANGTVAAFVSSLGGTNVQVSAPEEIGRAHV